MTHLKGQNYYKTDNAIPHPTLQCKSCSQEAIVFNSILDFF